MACDNCVEHSMAQQKFRRLKAVRQLLIGGLLDDAPSSEANYGARLGQIQITEAGKRSRNAAGSRIA